jgi:microcystin-dependent protein
MAFWSWSKAAASNATADSTINWAEGQSPSSVNDSARAMMARTAEWRDDVSGTIATGGVSTAYTVASNQGFDTLAHLGGAMIAFVPHATCGATVTLNVDGLGARPLRTSPGVELPSGLLIQGTPYVATYNNADGAFYLRGFFSLPYAIPIGGLLPYVGASAPNSSFALPFGQAISRTTYATLFALVGTTFGTGDGSTTFNIPDLRGRAVFGLDNMGGSAASRITVAGGNFDGSALGGVGGAQNHTLTQGEMPSHTHTASVTDPGHTHTLNAANAAGASGVQQGTIQFTLGATVNTAITGISVTNASTGGGGAHTILNPAMVLPFILRVI